MKEWLKIEWHCFTKTFANIASEDHRHIAYHNCYAFRAFHFCTCGYNKPYFLK